MAAHISNQSRAEQQSVRLQELALHLFHSEKHERLEIAKHIHDKLQQTLSISAMLLNQTMKKSDEPKSQELKVIQDLIYEAIGISRDITIQLYPPVLYDFGLPAALQWLARWFRETHDFEVHVVIDPPSIAKNKNLIDETVSTLLFFAARELLFNAINHSGQGSATLDLKLKDQKIEMKISDQGKGFDPNALFAASEDGGFGLFSIRERLEFLKGEMTIESSHGAGTTVRLCIDPGSTSAHSSCTISPDVSNVHVHASLTPTSQIRVLVADDHRIVREGLVELLNNAEEIKVIAQACNGEEAVELARTLKPDLIVMDISMPKMNGIEATRIIHTELPSIRIIGLSMHGDSEVANRMKAAGASDYLLKGVPTEDLIETILCHSAD